VRFHPKSNPSSILIGEPVNPSLDVGLAVLSGADVPVALYSGSSILSPGSRTDRTESILKLLSPLSSKEVGSIRCIGLNYVSHAAEMKLDIPTVPTLFLKPSTSLGDPYPASSTILPKITQEDGTGDYESEMAIIIGQDAKDVSEEEALDYVLGYTAANDISSRTSQMNQSQWCFSKGFDGACPLGPVVVSKNALGEDGVAGLRIRGIKNGVVMQDCQLTDLIFSVPKLVSFLSQGTTLPAGTVILTGTPPGVGAAKNPKEFLRDGDEFRVELLPFVGTLVSKIENQV
jgi:2-keto-4-pentenoate hydratase/2-oxohepta-3-ene-1,7-dioic acid hydratase in catechol pathway